MYSKNIVWRSLERFIDWLNYIWRNPIWNCEKCLHVRDTYSWWQIQETYKGFNKTHRHKRYKFTGMKSCVTCEAVKQNYLEKDLVKFRISGEDHFKPRVGATPILGKGNTMATATKIGPTGQWYWHVHHAKLVEKLTDPIETRQSYVRNSKGAEVATRLHFMRPVKNPPTGSANTEAIARAEKTLKNVQRAYDNWQVDKAVLLAAQRKLDNARALNVGPTQADWEALHKKECFSYCPWNGQTLFPLRTHGIA